MTDHIASATNESEIERVRALLLKQWFTNCTIEQSNGLANRVCDAAIAGLRSAVAGGQPVYYANPQQVPQRGDAVNLASNVLGYYGVEGGRGMHLTTKGIRSLAEAVMLMDAWILEVTQHRVSPLAITDTEREAAAKLKRLADMIVEAGAPFNGHGAAVALVANALLRVSMPSRERMREKILEDPDLESSTACVSTVATGVSELPKLTRDQVEDAFNASLMYAIKGWQDGTWNCKSDFAAALCALALKSFDAESRLSAIHDADARVEHPLMPRTDSRRSPGYMGDVNGPGCDPDVP